MLRESRSATNALAASSMSAFPAVTNSITQQLTIFMLLVNMMLALPQCQSLKGTLPAGSSRSRTGKCFLVRRSTTIQKVKSLKLKFLTSKFRKSPTLNTPLCQTSNHTWWIATVTPEARLVSSTKANNDKNYDTQLNI